MSDERPRKRDKRIDKKRREEGAKDEAQTKIIFMNREEAKGEERRGNNG